MALRLIKRRNKIVLQLEEYERYIGVIKNRTYYKRINGSHIFHKIPSIGINAELMLNYGGLFDNIVVYYNDKEYSISRADAYKYGYFSQEGYFEPQIFIPLSKWKIKDGVTNEG